MSASTQTLTDDTPVVPPTPEGDGAGLGAFLSGRLRQVGIFLALIAIVILFQILTGGTLLTPRNVTSIIGQNAYVLILAIGMVMIIIAGHIDLSVGSVVAFVGAISGILIVNWGWPWWLGVLAAIIVGGLVGAWQGFWIAYVGIPAFIVTLAGMLTFRGLTQMVLQNEPITPFPDAYVAIGSGFLPDLGGGTSTFEPLTVVLGVLATIGLVGSQFRERAKRVKLGLEDEPRSWFLSQAIFTAVFILLITFTLASYRGTPIVLVILAALILIYSTVMHQFVFGRHIYARGGNLHAAQLSGVDTKRVDFLLFVNMGLLAGIAGHRLHRAQQLRPPGRRHRLRARRHRRRVHRRRGRHRRHRHGHRRDHRWPDHGRAEQRHVAARPRHRGPVLHQGLRAAAGRRLRHLQQAARRERQQVSTAGGHERHGPRRRARLDADQGGPGRG